MCSNHDFPHEDRVKQYWSDYKRDVPNHSIEEMMRYFNLSESEAIDIIADNPELVK